MPQTRAVARVPSGLDVLEQRRHLASDGCRRECRFVFGCLGRGQLHPPFAPPGAPPGCPPCGLLRPEPPARMRREVHDQHRHDDQPDEDRRPDAVAEDGDPDQNLDQDVEAQTAAASTAAASKAPRASTCGGQRFGRERQCQEQHSEQDQPSALHPLATSRAIGPIPGSCWATCSSAW